MARHKLQIVYDDATGTVTASHRCAVEAGGREVSHARPVELAGDAAAALRAFVDQNRAAMEQETGLMAVRHAAAVSGRVQPGVTPLKAGGSLGSLGAAAAAKE